MAAMAIVNVFLFILCNGSYDDLTAKIRKYFVIEFVIEK